MRRPSMRAIAMLLAVVTMFSQPYCASAETASEKAGDAIVWDFDSASGTLTFSGIGEIPAQDENVYAPWRSYLSQIKQLVIADGITAIGASAFAYIPNLEIVTLAQSVMRIGSAAFINCDSLTNISLGNNVACIGAEAFANTAYYLDEANWNLDVLYLENYLLCARDTLVGDYTVSFDTTLIADRAFYACANLTEVYIYEKLKVIGEGAFRNCTSLNGIYVSQANEAYCSSDFGVLFNKDKTELILCPMQYAGALELPSTLTMIADFACCKCEGLTEVTIPSGVISIGEYAFYQCTALQSVTIPDCVTSIGMSAFRACSSLAELKLEAAVTTLPVAAFADCTALQQLVIPDCVERIESSAFLGCTTLENISVGQNVRYIGKDVFRDTAFEADLGNWTDGILYLDEYLLRALPDAVSGNLVIESTVSVIAGDAFNSCTSLLGIEIPGSVRSIGESAFMHCNDIETIVLSEGLEYIGTHAFYGCSGFNVLTLPDSLSEIGNYAFAECTGIMALGFGNGIKKIGEGAFLRCTSITSVTLPAAVEFIADSAFHGCAELGAILVDEGNEAYCNDEYGVLYTKDMSVLLKAPAKLEGSYAIKSDCVRISADAFAECTALTQIVLADSIEVIGQCAFYCCTALEKISFASEEGAPSEGADSPLLAICHEAFYGCSALAQVNLPYTVYQIGYGAFAECASLEAIMIYQPLCIIDELELTLADPMHCVIYGFADSTAQAYADKFSQQFVLLECSHDYVAIEQVEPTCIQKGYTLYQCKLCGHLNTDDYIKRLGHDFQDGFCTRCGKEEPEYIDVSTSSWYYEAVKFVTDQGLMNGVSADSFAPDAQMTRAMLVTVLWRAEGQPKIGSNYFTDVEKGQWYTDAVAWASYYQIVNGVGNRKFEPNSSITREQIATILFRYSDFLGYGTDGRASIYSFPDHSKVSSWAKTALSWAVAHKYIVGTQTENGIYLDPLGNATRAQVATILMRFLED